MFDILEGVRYAGAMSYDRGFIEVELEKKRGQVEKHRKALEVKKRKNRRRDSERARLYGLIDESKARIKELEAMVAYHERMIPQRQEKLAAVKENEDISEAQEKFDRYERELHEMIGIGSKIEMQMDYIERCVGTGIDEMELEAHKKTLDDYIKELRKVKGRGF